MNLRRRTATSSMRRGAVFVLGLIVSAIALWVVAGSVDLHEVARRLGSAQLAPLAVLLAVLAVQIAVRATRWTFLLPRRNQGRIPSRRVVPPLMIGYLGNAVLPARLGEPTRALLVARREQIPGALAFGSVVLERVVDMAVLALVMLPAAWLAGAPRWIIDLAVAAAVVAGVVLVVLVAGGIAAPARWLSRASVRLGEGRLASIVAQAAGRIAEFARGAAAAGRQSDVAIAVGLTGLAWLLDAVAFWLAAASLGVELELAGALVIAGVAVIGTAVPSAPGYVGTYELAASTAAIALGVSPESALALAIVVHALTLLFVAVAGIASLFLVQRQSVPGNPAVTSAVAYSGPRS